MPLAGQHPLSSASALSRAATFSARAAREDFDLSLAIRHGRSCDYSRDNRSAKHCSRNLPLRRRHKAPIQPSNREGLSARLLAARSRTKLTGYYELVGTASPVVVLY